MRDSTAPRTFHVRTDESHHSPYKTFHLASKSGEPEIGGAFFGQSSFANLSIVRECSVVNAKELVRDKKELQLFAPLGCGIQTGSGTVVNAAKATKNDVIVILGLGGVGLSAVMGAKVQGYATASSFLMMKSAY